MNYNEYTCPCRGRTERRKHDLINRGFFRDKFIFIYYYECMDCGETSELYEEDITHKFKEQRRSEPHWPGMKG